MTAAAYCRKPGPLLAHGAAGATISLSAVAVLSFAASLILIASLMAGRGALDLRERLVGSATVVVRASGLESSDAAAARAADVLGRTNGVARAWPLDAAAVDPIIARLVDGGSSAGGAPRLVAIEFKAARAPTAAALARILRADGLRVGVDDHQPRSSPLARAAILAGLAAAALLVTIAFLVGAVVAFVTGRRIATRPELTNLLRLAGASDSFLGGLYASDAARGAALGGAAGAVAAVLAVGVWRLSGPGQSLEIAFPFAWVNLVAVAPWPLVTGLVGWLSARLAVRSALSGAP